MEKIAKVLSDKTHREILKLLYQKPMTNMEIYDGLRGSRVVSITYRESVFKALKKLVNAGLVEKIYDKEKGVCYKLLYYKLTIDIVKEIVNTL